MEKENTTLVPFWKLRRLAPRSVRVLGRRSGEFPAIAAYKPTLKPNAEEYIAKYDESRRYRADWKREMDEGRGAIADLVKGIRSWQPLVQRDVPGFDSSDFADKPDVPDDVIEDGGRIIDTVIDFQEKTGKPLTYAEDLIDNLEILLKAAVKEWPEAEAADKKYQDLLGAVRERAPCSRPTWSPSGRPCPRW